MVLLGAQDSLQQDRGHTAPNRTRTAPVRPVDEGPIREAPLSISRAFRVKVRPLLVDNIRFRPVNKPGCQHEKIGACVPLTAMIGVSFNSLRDSEWRDRTGFNGHPYLVPAVNLLMQ